MQSPGGRSRIGALSQRASRPTLVILVGVIGGTLAHGIVGLFIGPIVLSVAWELTAAWIATDRSGVARNASDR